MFCRRFAALLFSLALVPVLTLLAGCHHQVIQQPATLQSRGADAGQYTREEYLEDIAWYDLASGRPQRDGSGKLVLRTSAPDLVQAKEARDKIVYGLMGQIDLVYSVYYQKTFASKNSVAIVGDILTLGLGAGGTIATNVATKTIFAALGTSFSGVNLSIDKNLYAQQSFQVIGIAMQTRRDAARRYIVESLAQGVSDYPLAKAKRDLVAYMSAGTLAAGLQELQEEAGAATAKGHTDSPALPAPPATPSKPYALSGDDSVTLVWVPVPGATAYTVYRGTSLDVTATNGLQLGQVAVPAFEDRRSPTTPDSFYVVRAVNPGGASGVSPSVQASSSGTTATTPIQAPASVYVLDGGTQDVVGWTSVAGAKGYSVKFAAAQGDVTNATPATVTVPYFLNPLVTAGQAFFYSVASIDASNTVSGYSAPVTYAAPAAPAVGAPAPVGAAAPSQPLPSPPPSPSGTNLLSLPSSPSVPMVQATQPTRQITTDH